MNFIVFVVVLAVIAGKSSAANLTVATSIEEYTTSWGRKFKNDIEIADMKIACVDGRGSDSIKVLRDQQEEILKEITRYQETLVPVESLSIVRKHCVQKYKSMLVTYDTALAQFASCTNAAQTRINSLTATAKASSVAAKNSAYTNLPRALVSCNSTHFTNPTKHEECVVSNIDAYSSSILANMRAVDKNLDASLCTSTDTSRDAIQCMFNIERNILVTMGKVSNLMETCIKEADIACPCAKNFVIESNPTTTTAAPKKR